MWCLKLHSNEIHDDSFEVCTLYCREHNSAEITAVKVML